MAPASRTPMTTAKPHDVCGAKNRQGKPCQVAPMENGRCYRHGGATPVGPALPQYRHGKRSKLFKHVKGFGAAYERALKDPDLLRLDDEIAVCDARFDDVVERGTKKKLTMDQLWPQLEPIIELRRKLADTESKRRRDLGMMLGMDRVFAIMTFVRDAVVRNVSNPKELTAILNELRRVMPPGAVGG